MRAIRTEHATISLLRSNQCAATGAVMEVDACIGRHRFSGDMAAFRAGQIARGLHIRAHCLFTFRLDCLGEGTAKFTARVPVIAHPWVLQQPRGRHNVFPFAPSTGTCTTKVFSRSSFVCDRRSLFISSIPRRQPGQIGSTTNSSRTDPFARLKSSRNCEN